ncbi:MAG: tetratricopeptide repeat protein [Nitrospirae bacterium]|nr:tetratricopeptide repeat protein [Nitrospirota bacterium]
MNNLFRNPISHLFLIAIIGLLAYSNTFNVPFLFDDKSFIAENPIVKTLSFFIQPSKARMFNTSNNGLAGYETFKLRYIGYLTFALNYRIHGLDVRGYHIFNLAIHILNAILVYWFVTLTLRIPYFSSQLSAVSYQDNTEDEKIRRWEDKNFSTSQPLNFSTSIALFSALLFVSHPIQTQAVTFTWQRVTSLATFFYLLSLVMYIKWRLLSTIERQNDSKEKIAWRLPHCRSAGLSLYLISLLSAVLAMKTKEIAFTLPVVIALYEFMFFEGKIKRRILYLSPLLLTMLFIPFSLINVNGSILNLISHANEVSKGAQVSVQDYLLTQLRVIVTYIRLLFFPINQNLDYDYPVYSSFFESQIVLSFLFLFSVFGLGIYLFYRSRATIPPFNSPLIKGGYRGVSRITRHVSRLIAFGIFWFFITLSVESSIMPISPFFLVTSEDMGKYFFDIEIIFEHRMYLPSIGLIIAFSTALFYVLQRLDSATVQQNDSTAKQSSSFSFLPAALSLYCSVALIIFFPITTYRRNTIWQSERSLWEDVVKKSPNKPGGHNNLGVFYNKKGLTDKAIEQLGTVLRLRPNYVDAYNSLGIIYNNKGLINRAMEYLEIALRLRPDNPETHYNLGIVYTAQRLTDEAIKHLEIAIRLKPYYPKAHNNLGIAYWGKGLLDKASNEFQTAIMFEPDYPEAHNNLGNIYYAQGLLDAAIQEYKIAINLNPKYVDARNNLGSAYMDKGWIDMSIKQFQIAIKLKPDYAEAYNNLGLGYEQKGLPDMAVMQYRTALRINPEDESSRNNLHRILR